MKNFLYGILFCLIVLWAGPAHAVTMVSGSSVTGSVPGPAPCNPNPPGACYDYQTFTGTTGHGIIITVVDGFGAASIAVFKPDGTQLGATGNQQFSYSSLPVNGTYTVRINSNTTGYGSYTAYYVAGAEGVSNGALTSGATATASLPAGGLVSYTFSGTTGYAMQARFAAAGLSYDANISVYKPDGSYWTYGLRAFTSTSLPNTGTYTVVVQGTTTTASGSFSLAYVAPNGTVGAVSNGALKSGAFINGTLPAGLMTSYTFHGTAGQPLAFTVGGLPLTYMYIYKTDGTYWTVTSSRMWYSTSIPTTGDYTVVIVAQSYADHGDYNMYSLFGGGDVSDGPLVNGKQRSGTMLVSGLRSYKFEAVAGDSITVNTSCPFGASGCYTWIYKPNGTYWTLLGGTGWPWSGTVPTGGTGEYDLGIYEANLAATGTYTLSVATTPPAVPACDKTKCGICPECLRRAIASLIASASATVGGILGRALDVGPAVSPVLGAAPGAPVGAPAGSGGDSLSGAGDTISGSDFNINGGMPFAGNGMEFATGFKQQNVVDYQAGGLSFARIYRSDATWTNNTIGTYWRHNYARSLTVVTGTSATITDGMGITNAYTWSGSAWVASDPSNRATFQTITGGYAYTLPNGNVEKYNSSKLLARVEFQGGGALNLTYNGSNQLTGIANENGRSLSLTYDGSGRVSTLVTPDGTFTYTYDSNSNLQKLTKPDTKTVQYGYTNATYIHALTSITNELGTQVATFGYDATTGNVNNSQFAGGVGSWGVTYNTGDTSTATNRSARRSPIIT